MDKFPPLPPVAEGVPNGHLEADKVSVLGVDWGAGDEQVAWMRPNPPQKAQEGPWCDLKARLAQGSVAFPSCSEILASLGNSVASSYPHFGG